VPWLAYEDRNFTGELGGEDVAIHGGALIEQKRGVPPLRPEN
jgi:hypothetical protein